MRLQVLYGGAEAVQRVCRRASAWYQVGQSRHQPYAFFVYHITRRSKRQTAMLITAEELAAVAWCIWLVVRNWISDACRLTPCVDDQVAFLVLQEEARRVAAAEERRGFMAGAETDDDDVAPVQRRQHPQPVGLSFAWTVADTLVHIKGQAATLASAKAGDGRWQAS